MKIEAGKYYKTRDGRKVGPMVEEEPLWSDWPWGVEGYECDLGRTLWEDDGTADETQDADLIAEWTEATADPPKLWRDMTDQEKGALLLAAHEGKEIEYRSEFSSGVMCKVPVWYDNVAYRIKPEPVVETVALCWKKGLAVGQVGTIDLIDGKPDCSSIKMGEI